MINEWILVGDNDEQLFTKEDMRKCWTDGWAQQEGDKTFDDYYHAHFERSFPHEVIVTISDNESAKEIRKNLLKHRDKTIEKFISS